MNKKLFFIEYENAGVIISVGLFRMTVTSLWEGETKRTTHNTLLISGEKIKIAILFPLITPQFDR